MSSSSHSLATLGRVPTPLALVGGLHLAVIWAFLSGLQIHNTPALRPHDMAVEVIERQPVWPDTRPQPLNGEPLKIKFTEPPPQHFDVDSVDTAPTTAFNPTATRPLEFQDHGGTAEPAPKINPAAVDPHHPLTQPAYPMSSRHLQEEGALVLDILVGADGHVRDARVSRSSGFERLDAAALSEAKQHWRLRPATRNGVAFEQWLSLRVVFRLEER